MSLLKDSNLAIRFLLELSALAALGAWGFTVDAGRVSQIVLGLGAPLAAAVVWSLFIAPKASLQTDDPVRLGLELLVFGAAAAALYVTDRPELAAALAIVFVINRTLVVAWNQ